MSLFHSTYKVSFLFFIPIQSSGVVSSDELREVRETYSEELNRHFKEGGDYVQPVRLRTSLPVVMAVNYLLIPFHSTVAYPSVVTLERNGVSS